MRAGRRRDLPGRVRVRRVARPRRLPRAHRRALRARRLLVRGRRHQARAQRAAPPHALQLCFYSAGSQRVQGVAPVYAHVELGSGRARDDPLREIGSVLPPTRGRHSRRRRERAPTEPYPVRPLRLLRVPAGVRSVAGGTSDHLTRVAGLRRDQVDLLAAAAWRRSRSSRRCRADATVAGSAAGGARAPASAGAPPASRPSTARRRRTSSCRCEPGRGFALLPEPSAGDVMFDFEGDPFWTPARGLDVPLRPALARRRRLALRADLGARPRRGEARRSSGSSTCSRRASPSTPTCTSTTTAPPSRRRSSAMAQHATREAEVDDLLRREVFVDL